MKHQFNDPTEMVIAILKKKKELQIKAGDGSSLLIGVAEFAKLSSINAVQLCFVNKPSAFGLTVEVQPWMDGFAVSPAN